MHYCASIVKPGTLQVIVRQRVFDGFVFGHLDCTRTSLERPQRNAHATITVVLKQPHAATQNVRRTSTNPQSRPGGSGVLDPLVMKLCTKCGDMSQSSGTPRVMHYEAKTTAEAAPIFQNVW